MKIVKRKKNYKMRNFKILASALFVMASLNISAQGLQEIKMKSFVDGLMKKMTIDEKIGQLNLVTRGGGVATGAVVSNDVESKIAKGFVGGLFGINGPDNIRKAQELAITKSRLHIPLIFGSDIIHGYKTIFPIPLALSCSWDTLMIERSARLAAIEASADGLCWTFSPMVDIARDPRWGRVAEGAGEDPYLGSKIARAMVKGYQGDDLSKNNTILACVKHFALYGAAEAGRDYNTVDMSRARMYNEYLPPYKAAVDVGVGSVMTSFNVVDGIPATGNQWLLTDLLRKKWGFKGFVVSDYTALNEMTAHGMGDLAKVSALALKAGLDMDMVGEGFLLSLKKLLYENKITIHEINTACRRILEAKYKLGLFIDPFLYCNNERAAKEVLSPDKRSAAREFATHSIVLLKNRNNILPLKKSATIALVGPLAKSKQNMLGTWSVSGNWKESVSVLEGIKEVAGKDANIFYAKGANISDESMQNMRGSALIKAEMEKDKRSAIELLNESIELANKADVIVAVVGESANMSGEASSRADINIPESQKKLLRELAKTGKPLVIVLFNGRPLLLNWENEHAEAMLEVWFGGTEAGNAVADVLFGNYNPSGKLTVSFPYSVGQIPVYYNHLNTGRPYDTNNPSDFKSNYIDIPNEPLYPFGFGLSYTFFEIGSPNLDKVILHSGEKLQVQLTIKNTGDYAGEEVVQLYIQNLAASIVRPVKELKAFNKVFLKQGESKRITFTITEEDLKFYDNEMNSKVEAGVFKVFVGNNSRDVQETSFELVKK
jgi:beta-glucosidase